MRFNIFSTVSTRKPASPTTMPSQSTQPQRRPAQLPPTPLRQHSKLRGALRSVLEVLHLRRSNPKNDKLNQDYQVYQASAIPFQHPSTTTQGHKLIFTSAVPLTTATPSTTASVAALADISPLFAPQPAESTTTPTITFSCPSPALPSPPVATDLLSTKDMIAELESAVSRLERQEAHQAHIHKLNNPIATGIETFINQRDVEAEARRRAEDRLARKIASRKKVEEWMLQERNRRWDVEDAARDVLRHQEKKKEGLNKNDFLTPDEALQGLGFVDVWDPMSPHGPRGVRY